MMIFVIAGCTLVAVEEYSVEEFVVLQGFDLDLSVPLIVCVVTEATKGVCTIVEPECLRWLPMQQAHPQSEKDSHFLANVTQSVLRIRTDAALGFLPSRLSLIPNRVSSVGVTVHEGQRRSRGDPDHFEVQRQLHGMSVL